MKKTHSHAAVDYDALPDQSLWGHEDKPTLAAIHKIVKEGTWLNLASGDGRFNNALLSHCNNVIVADNNVGALSKLVRLTPAEFVGRVKTKVIDITRPLPFPSSHFAGCLCTATLHIFDQPTLKTVISEIIRVIRSSGSIILDFLTDIECTLPDGSLYTYSEMPNYTSQQARAMLKESFKNHPYEIMQYERGPMQKTIGDVSYVLRSQCLLLTCNLHKP